MSSIPNRCKHLYNRLLAFQRSLFVGLNFFFVLLCIYVWNDRRVILLQNYNLLRLLESTNNYHHNADLLNVSTTTFNSTPTLERKDNVKVKFLPPTIIPPTSWVKYSKEWHGLRLPVITCRPEGRLGNLMGEYATMYSLKRHYNVTVVMNKEFKKKIKQIFLNTSLPDIPASAGHLKFTDWTPVKNIGSRVNYAPIELAAAGLLGAKNFIMTASGSFVLYDCQTITHPNTDPTITHPNTDPTITHPNTDPTITHPNTDSTITHPNTDPTITHPNTDPTITHPNTDPTITHPNTDPTITHPNTDPTITHPNTDPTITHPNTDPTITHPNTDPTITHPNTDPTKELMVKANGFLSKIMENRSSELPDPVFVGFHIRRTDYEGFFKRRYGGRLPETAYYTRALSHYRTKFPDAAVFIVASDDLKYARSELDQYHDVFFSPGFSPGEDMALLASCNHSIITVGSYGFWSAYLAGGEVVYADVTSKIEYRFSRKIYEKSGLDNFIPLPID
ncbi:hypothetical protein Pcinc_006737 [Petrolisthes cinctipes]|uniref:L-Fucosyltransferase n=1 Tax=Petrolisthes cinctipes TaxID=88211 RepID=A0AAE1KZ80_PETCI|nr:hypothetical protein Pcinc_006737 [Petrolisthes cinctipes]